MTMSPRRGVLRQDAAGPFGQEVERHGNPRPAVGKLADHQPVALEQYRHHRFGRDVEGLGDEAVKAQHRQRQPEEALDLAPQGIRAFRRRGRGDAGRVRGCGLDHRGITIAQLVSSSIAVATA
jgi:hypothetical protein